MTQCSAELYTLRDRPGGDRYVVACSSGGYAFPCPCGRRMVWVLDHTVRFSPHGVMDIEESLAVDEETRELVGYCHFHIRRGKHKFVNDASCGGVK